MMSEASKLVKKSPPPAIAISSGKGGVGKTFLSVHLANRAVQQGKRVLLVDADLGLANVDVMLGITAPGNIQQVVDGETQLSDIVVTHSNGFDVLPGGSGLHELTHLSAMQQRLLLDEMNALTFNYDLVLIDTAAGIGENVLYFTSCAESVLIVLTPDPTSLTDAYALIKVLSRQRDVGKFMVAINQADEVQAQITFRRLLSVADRYLDVVLDFVGFMPEYNKVRAAIQSQQLLHSFADSSRIDSLNQLLDSILAQPPCMRSGAGMQLFWQRALGNDLGYQSQADAAV
jgi:flagellar biosynthesis protein FlhG